MACMTQYNHSADVHVHGIGKSTRRRTKYPTPTQEKQGIDAGAPQKSKNGVNGDVGRLGGAGQSWRTIESTEIAGGNSACASYGGGSAESSAGNRDAACACAARALGGDARRCANLPGAGSSVICGFTIAASLAGDDGAPVVGDSITRSSALVSHRDAGGAIRDERGTAESTKSGGDGLSRRFRKVNLRGRVWNKRNSE
jgi:hypothetical protein